ncbi:hypothetical protein [Actinomadura sp. 9N215]|uniref:hypothetical protein n=1 Tax=Actinomadura sp. 9N215 TaxID=3375150 RepID=UPI0037A0DED2
MLPNASHLLIMEHAETVRAMVQTFLTTDAAPTFMPIARGARQTGEETEETSGETEETSEAGGGASG